MGQEVCPFNQRRSTLSNEPAVQPRDVTLNGVTISDDIRAAGVTRLLLFLSVPNRNRKRPLTCLFVQTIEG